MFQKFIYKFGVIMNHYLDIQIKPDAEMRINVLLNKVYIKLHKVLYSSSIVDIGISFPKYKILLGNILRLHSNQQSLEKLQSINWLGGLSSYCILTEILPIPDKVKYRTISRKQTNMTTAKLRRLIKRESITENDAKKYKAKLFTQGLDNAYLELDSSSNGHKYRRYIEFGELQSSSVTGVFDQFGLSKVGTIPWF
jgi:CRISPR-associated endonuclease Csy4